MIDDEPLLDEVMRDIRAVREAYAARFGYDPSALFDHARRQARQSDREVVRRDPRRVEERGAAGSESTGPFEAPKVTTP